MSTPFGHQKLHNRYCFEGKLEIVTPLRISSGRASDSTDAPFIRTFGDKPYIPGSSLRGAVRSEVERIINGVGETVSGLTSCTLFDKDACAEKIEGTLKKLQEEEEKKPRVDRRSDDELLAAAAEEKLCDVCRLFGSTMYASRIVFEDGGYEGSPHLIIRDGVGIDRDTGAARDGVKFDYEVLEQGNFSFRMVAENIAADGNDGKLLNLILGVLKQGLHVGGKRAGGMGEIKLKNILTTGFEDSKQLWDALVAGKDINQPLEWKEVI